MSAETASQFRGRSGSKATQFCISDTEEHLMYFEGL